MKINYSIDKKDLEKEPELAGVKKAAGAKKHTPKKDFSHNNWVSVVLVGVIGFMLVALGAYLFHIPLVVSAVDIFTNKVSTANKIVYRQFTVSISDNIPPDIKKAITDRLASIEYNGQKRFTITTGTADVTLGYSAKPGQNDTVFSTSYLVPVGHMYWIRDTATTANLSTDTVIVPQGRKAMYETILQQYYGKIPNLQESANVPNTLKGSEKSAALIDVNDLSGTYKPLSLDGHYFLDKDTRGGIPYSLVLTASNDTAKSIVEARIADLVPASFSSADILTLDQTGVTAITRGLGVKTNASGDSAYAARKIGDFLKQADLTHVSNEISSVPGCQPGVGTTFCALPSYLNALKKSGVDIVELTGNHNNDYGAKYNTATINSYKSFGWDYFGGGLNKTDAAKILYEDVKGTKIAFLGYNYYDSTVGNPGALATSSHAGANSWSPTKVKNDIAEARKNADIVIVDFQYQECYAYSDDFSVVYECYSPIGNQEKDFRYAIDNGADIVVGTQAHQVQTYEIYKGKPIFYGLGNLFFDQIQWLGTRQGLILTHYFYKGKYLSTKITTTLYNSDLLTYITTGSQRSSLLKTLKQARNF